MKQRLRRPGEKGQVMLMVVILLLLVVVIIVAMVFWVQRESAWSVKEGKNTIAFDLAEGAIDKALRKITESTTTWNNIQNGTIPSGYNFDTSYSEITGGTYALAISSGPSAQQVTLIGVGRDNSKKETRRINAVYANAPMGGTAIRSQGSVTASGTNVQVEWGAVMSNQTINTNNRNHPQFFSSSHISPQDGGSTSALCDSPSCWQWYSYYANIPPTPNIDFAFYQASATATGTYFNSTQNWPGAPCAADATSCATGNVYYINGDLNLSSPGIYIQGTLIVTGNLNLPNGRSGQGGPTVPLPQQAWKQYGNDWAYYTGGAQSACSVSWNDTTPPPGSYPGRYSTYLSNSGLTVTFSDSKVMVNGFTYIGGNLNSTGGSGQSKFVGAFYVVGTVTLGSNNVCVFYTTAAGQNIATTTVSLSRISWQDYSPQGWPPGLP